MTGNVYYKDKDIVQKHYQYPYYWSIEKIEDELGIKCTNYTLPRWMIDKRNAFEAALKRRGGVRQRLLKAYFKRWGDEEREYAEQSERFQEIAKPFKKANALSRTKKIKQNQNAGERWLSSRSVSL